MINLPAKNIIVSFGALNAIPPVEIDLTKKQNGIILIGGTSKNFHWSNNSIIRQIKKIISKSDQVNWELTISRRTPVEFLYELKKENLTQIKVLDEKQSIGNWIEKNLPLKEEAWVTIDSVSMVYESLTASCKTGILKLKPKKFTSKISENIEFLWRENYLMSKDGGTTMNLKHKAFKNEADMCAKHIVKELLNLTV